MPKRQTIYLFGGERLVVERMRHTAGQVWVIPDDALTDKLRRTLEAHNWDGLVVQNHDMHVGDQLMIRPIKNYHVSRTMGLRCDQKVNFTMDGDAGTTRTIEFIVLDDAADPVGSYFDSLALKKDHS